VKSELDRVRGKEVGMVSNQMEAGWHALEWKQARNRVPSKEGGAEASRHARCRPYSRWACRRTGARRASRAPEASATRGRAPSREAPPTER
jgi:hypothetical protein